jgi:Tfp pilus assembly protein PilX
MSRSGTPSTSPRPRGAPRTRAQRGQSIVSVMLLVAVLGIAVAATLGVALATTNGTARDARGDVALQAADAGVRAYMARLAADGSYWDHYVDKAEDPRSLSTDTSCTGTKKAAGSAWTSGTLWKYCGTSSTWVSLQNARYGQASYSLRITPPSTGSDIVTILSTGRVQPSGGGVARYRSVSAQVRPTSLSDFQAISQVSISYGSTATTGGKIYSAQNVTHDGLAKAAVYAQGRVTGSGTFQKGKYDSTTNPSISQIYPQVISFSQFTSALATLKDAALSAGTNQNYFDDSTVGGWLVQLRSDGTASIWKLKKNYDLGASMTSAMVSNCTTPLVVTTTDYEPMWFQQPVVISSGTNPCGSGRLDSTVNGRITIGTPTDLYVGGNISYQQAGDDVLGLISGDDLDITRYTPSTLTWTAATLAMGQSGGQWHTDSQSADGNHSSMTFTGSQAMANGGYATMFSSRTYNYDPNLLYTRPPLFPIVDGTWATVYWREVTPP